MAASTASGVRVDGASPEEGLVPASQQPGVVVRLAPHHHAIHMLEVGGDLFVGGHTAVQADGQVREVRLSW
jgi:hypothetical protein